MHNQDNEVLDFDDYFIEEIEFDDFDVISYLNLPRGFEGKEHY